MDAGRRLVVVPEDLLELWVVPDHAGIGGLEHTRFLTLVGPKFCLIYRPGLCDCLFKDIFYSTSFGEYCSRKYSVVVERNCGF